MKRKHLHQPFELHVLDMENWNEQPLTYQFFEIVHIIEGKGTRMVNDNHYPYDKGGIFLFTPMDCRGFESCTPTRFCSIRFSGTFLEQYRGIQERENLLLWLKKLENIFTHHNRFERLLIRSDGDCHMISSLIENMISEYANKDVYHRENLQLMVTMVLNIISRNVAKVPVTSPDKQYPEPLINSIIIYINQNISIPQKLRIKHLAEQFNLSASYVGEYFKKLTGESLHCYITQYRMNMIEERLHFSSCPIGQIAQELGFSDESHLSRQFKKSKGITPAEFRRRKSEFN